MLTLSTVLGLIWIASSFACLFAVPFVVLFYTVKKGYSRIKIVIIQLLCWVLILAYIHIVFGGFWFLIGIMGPTLTMG